MDTIISANEAIIKLIAEFDEKKRLDGEELNELFADFLKQQGDAAENV